MSSWFSCQYEQTLGKEGGFIFLTVFWGVGGLDIQFVVSGRWGSGSVHSQLLASQQDENQTLSQVSSSPPFIHSGLWTLSWCHSHSGWVPPPSSVRTFWKCPNAYAWRCVSEVTLSPGGLTVQISHHTLEGRATGSHQQTRWTLDTLQAPGWVPKTWRGMSHSLCLLGTQSPQRYVHRDC